MSHLPRLGHTLCDRCDTESELYQNTYGRCRACFSLVCPACMIPGTVDEDETITAICLNCEDALCDCGKEITKANPVYIETNSPGEPSYVEEGCKSCLPHGRRRRDPDEPTREEAKADEMLSDGWRRR